jgi:hypothetical protein
MTAATPPFAVSRPVKKRSVVRAFNDETAHQALTAAGFGPGREAFGFNKGQFSIVDLILAALRFTGPADATIATWTAADADLRRTAETMRAGLFTSVRWVVDRSFETRQPAFCATMRQLFGDNAIRTTNSHAKFILLSNAQWKLVIQTSMNLNFNRRIENFWVADDPELFATYSELVEDVFRLQAAGSSFGKDNASKARGQAEAIGRKRSEDPFSGVASAAGFGHLLSEI